MNFVCLLCYLLKINNLNEKKFLLQRVGIGVETDSHDRDHSDRACIYQNTLKFLPSLPLSIFGDRRLLKFLSYQSREQVV